MAVLTALKTAFRGSSGLSRAALNVGPADADTINQRKQTCANCDLATRTKATHIESLRVLSPTSTCSQCKCLISAKTKLAKERCPLGQW